MVKMGIRVWLVLTDLQENQVQKALREEMAIQDYRASLDQTARMV
jgi:hypothetical protein